MSWLLSKTFIISILILISKSNLEKDLVLEFFRFKSIQIGYVFDCFQIKERTQFTKELMNNSLRISENDVGENSILINIKLNRIYGIVIDGDCLKVNDLLKQAAELNLFHDIQRWLIIASNESIISHFANLTLNINTDLYVACPTSIGQNEVKNWTIKDVYNTASKHGGELKIENVGFYNVLQGLNIKTRVNKYWRRRNMTGTHFKTMHVFRHMLNMSFEEFVCSEQNRGIESFIRFQCRLMHHCKDFYNFSMKVLPTNSWGYEIANGKFDGLVGALKDGVVDFGCSGLFPRLERIPVVSFSRGIWNTRIGIIFRQPSIQSFARVFIQQMSTSLWYSTLGSIILILIALRISQRHENTIVGIVRDRLDHTWSTLILFTLGALSQQGYSQSPYLACGRIVTLSSFIFCLLFYQFYTGTIVSSLLTKPPPIIKTPKDLLESPLGFASDNPGYITEHLRTTKDPISFELYSKKVLRPGNKTNYYLPDYGMKLVLEGKFAYQVETTVAHAIIRDTYPNKAVCELSQIEIFPIQTVLTASRKNSPFRDMLNYCMLRLEEHGMGHRQKLFWDVQKPKCLESSNSIEIKVDLKEIYPALLLLFIGILMSLLILFIELYTSKKIKKKPKRKKGLVQHAFPFYN